MSNHSTAFSTLAFNRTTVECKLVNYDLYQSGGDTFNRTTVECKQASKYRNKKTWVNAFNRTTVECKHNIKADYFVSIHPLIELQ